MFFAEHGEDVVRYIGDLARRRGAKILTKSKSMATEEIELNHRLEEDYADLGLEIVETDLGGVDRPARRRHSLAHRRTDRAHEHERITEILSGVSDEELPPDVESLAAFARKRLREKFLNADIGITGANFGVAETGTICTVTNEGTRGSSRAFLPYTSS